MKLKIFVLIAICLNVFCFAEQERKTVIVTGASGELGGATARLLAQDYDLILTGRNVTKLKSLADELKSACSGQYEVVTLDYVNKTSRESFKDYLKQKHVSGLVLIVPRPSFYGAALLQDEKVWEEVFQSAFIGPTEVLKAVLPTMTNPGKIVAIAGNTSAQYQPNCGPSCVLRRMLVTYMKALSFQLGPQGISINTLSPGVMMTSFHEQRIQKKAKESGITYEQQMEKEVANIPLRRHGQPEEVAKTIRFLLSDQSDFVDGVNLVLDGGLTMCY